MQMKDRTKNMFADQLEEMLKSMSLDKVRVSLLCKHCGATPPTFYYYFHDKYELVAWMFLQDFAGGIRDRQPEYSADILNAVTKRMENHKTFYKKAFDDQSQNSISNYMQAFNLQIASDAYTYMTDGQALSQEQLFAVRYHNYGIMGMIQEWLFEETMTTEQMTLFLFEHTPDFLKQAFSVYPYSTENILQKSGKTTKNIKKQ